jgi:HEAT repeats
MLKDQILEFFELRLIARLEHSSTRELLKKMDNNSYYFPFNLYIRLFDRKSYYGGKTISWFATRQIENIHDIHDFEYLKTIIEKEDSGNEIIHNAYFALGHLTKNLMDKKIFDFLMEKLNWESIPNKQTILIALYNCQKPADYNLNPIYDIIKNGENELRANAVMCLKHSKNSISESLLLDLIPFESNKHVRNMAVTTLRDIGTLKSIETLKQELKNTRSNEYRYYLDNAIREIENRENGH